MESAMRYGHQVVDWLYYDGVRGACWDGGIVDGMLKQG